nr:MAG TPA: hypothetical protein [Caudoviricetes sp.]
MFNVVLSIVYYIMYYCLDNTLFFILFKIKLLLVSTFVISFQPPFFLGLTMTDSRILNFSTVGLDKLVGRFLYTFFV